MAFGISILTEIPHEKQEEETVATFQMFESKDLSIGTKNEPKHFPIQTNSPAVICTYLQCFTIASQKSLDEQPQFDEPEWDIASLKDNSESFGKNFKEVANIFLKEVEKYKHLAGKNTDSWKNKYGNYLTQGGEDKLIEMDKYLSDQLYKDIFSYIQDLYITDAPFRAAIEHDVRGFISREENRRIDNQIQKFSDIEKAYCKWYSTLHYLVENSLFILLGVREKIDVFCYRAQELSSFAALKNTERLNKIMQKINEKDCSIDPANGLFDWLELSFAKLSLSPQKAKIAVNTDSENLQTKLFNNNVRDRSISVLSKKVSQKIDFDESPKSFPGSSPTSSDDERDGTVNEMEILSWIVEAYQNDLKKLAEFASKYDQRLVVKVVALYFKDEVEKVSEFVKMLSGKQELKEEKKSTSSLDNKPIFFNTVYKRAIPQTQEQDDDLEGNASLSTFKFQTPRTS